MAFLTQRIIQSSLKLPATICANQEHDQPDVVVLPVRDGASPCDKPAVRIFLGTEAAQYKAERVFVWSIEQVRDPARVYEIYLMKNLVGFRSRFWLTGFTNYRFAIPHFAGGGGRAIYNDVDQVYLRDPGELFDLDMDGHGYLAIAPDDLSVALFDCHRMSQVWTLDDARTGHKNPLQSRAGSTKGLWGKLADCWNARDREYEKGQSAVLHFTALHRQPWQPFPKLFVYQANPAADVWFGLEQSANEAGFSVFRADAPSRAFRELSRVAQSRPPDSPRNGEMAAGDSAAGAGDLARLLEECHAVSVLDCRLNAVPSTSIMRVPGVANAGIEQVVTFDPTGTLREEAHARRLDAAVCLDALAFVPDDDIPWLLGQLFTRARRLLYCVVLDQPERLDPATATRLRRRSRTVEWWQYQFETVARHHPAVRWRLHIQRNRTIRGKRSSILEGNECYGRDAVVWVIANRKPGHMSQAIALAQCVGWSYQVIRVAQSLKALLFVMLRRNFGQVEPLRPPWPNVVIACGWWPARVARWIKMRSGGRVRLLLGGRKCGPVESPTDILVSCEHFRLPVHERRVVRLLPVHATSESRLDAARERGRKMLASSALPRVALLVGGSSKQHVLRPTDAALLGRRVLDQVRAAGGSLFAVTSRRTGSRAAEALAASLRGAATVHLWSRDEEDNPYLSYLAAADILIVTGESESMLADAVSMRKSVYVYPLTRRRHGPWLTLGARLAKCSQRRPRNRRGTERPQQGLEYLCSRILKREWVLPPRDIEGLHRRLVETGLVRMFEESLSLMEVLPPIIPDDLGPRLRIMLAQAQDGVKSQTGDLSSPTVTIEA